MREESGDSFVVDGSESDYPPEDGFVHTDLDHVFSLRDCAVVIEDIISPSLKVLENLRKLFHKVQRHNNLRLYFISHQINNNNTFSMVPLYHEIILTHDQGNHGAFQKIVKLQNFPQEESNETWSDFIKNTHDKLYLSINAKEKTMKIHNHLGTSPKLGFDDLVKRMRDILSSSFDGKHLSGQMVLLQHIFAPPHGIDRDLIESDLSMALEGKDSGATIRVSIVDYLAAITDGASADPGHDVFALHEYITSQLKIPKLLIKNSLFK